MSSRLASSSRLRVRSTIPSQHVPSLKRYLATPTSIPSAKLQEKDCSTIVPPYQRLLSTLDKVRDVLPKGAKLTLAEKILYAHLRNPEECLAGSKGLKDVRGQRYLKLRPDRVAMQVSHLYIGNEIGADVML